MRFSKSWITINKQRIVIAHWICAHSWAGITGNCLGCSIGKSVACTYYKVFKCELSVFIILKVLINIMIIYIRRNILAYRCFIADIIYFNRKTENSEKSLLKHITVNGWNNIFMHRFWAVNCNCSIVKGVRAVKAYCFYP